jgi:hypothetical protein
LQRGVVEQAERQAPVQRGARHFQTIVMRGRRAVFGRQTVVDRDHVKPGVGGKARGHHLMTVQRSEYEAAAVKVQYGAAYIFMCLSKRPVKPQRDLMTRTGAQPGVLHRNSVRQRGS